MKQVFIVTAGSYSDYHICAVFETEELAQQYVASFSQGMFCEMGIEEFTLNDIAPDNGLIAFSVRMLRDGTAEAVTKEGSDSEFDIVAPTARVYKHNNKMYVNCFAKNEAHAIKIASEKHTEAIANGEWPEDIKPETKPEPRVVFRGIIPTVHNVSEEEISALIQKYREAHPDDTETDEELRPAAVNSILGMRSGRKD